MLTSLASLWLPILVSGIALFFASWAAWMVLPHHKGDWVGLPNEETIMRQIKADNLPPGQYCFPYASSPEAMKSDAFKARMKAGPRGTLTLWKDPPNMGMNLVCTIVFFLIANAVIAYLAGMVIPPGNDRWFVFRFVGDCRRAHVRHGEHSERHLVRAENGVGYCRWDCLRTDHGRDLRLLVAWRYDVSCIYVAGPDAVRFAPRGGGCTYCVKCALPSSITSHASNWPHARTDQAAGDGCYPAHS